MGSKLGTTASGEPGLGCRRCGGEALEPFSPFLFMNVFTSGQRSSWISVKNVNIKTKRLIKPEGDVSYVPDFSRLAPRHTLLIESSARLTPLGGRLLW